MQLNAKIIAVVVAVVVVAAGVGAFLLMKSDNKGSSEKYYSFEKKATFNVYGNANGDTDIDDKDIEFIEDLLKKDFSYSENKLADANLDGKITNDDIDYINSMIKGTAKQVHYINVDGNDRTFNVKDTHNLIPLHRTVLRSALILASKDPSINIVASDTTSQEPEFAADTKLPGLVLVGKSTAPDTEIISNLEDSMGSIVIMAGRQATYASNLEEVYKNSDQVQIIRMNTWEGDALGGMLLAGYLLDGVGYKSPSAGGSGNTAWDQAKAYEKWYTSTLDVITDAAEDIDKDDRQTVLITYVSNDVGGKPFTDVYSSTANALRGLGSGDYENTVICGGNNLADLFTGNSDNNGRVPWDLESLAQNGKDVDVFIVLCKGMFYSANEFSKGETQLKNAFDGWLSPETDMYMVSWEMNGAPEVLQLAYFAKILMPDDKDVKALDLSKLWDDYVDLIGYKDVWGGKFGSVSFDYGPVHTTKSV